MEPSDPRPAARQVMAQHEVTKRIEQHHNSEKQRLIDIASRASQRAPHLDLACGRGDDIDKWRAAGLADVLGLDISQSAVDEARRRAGDDVDYTFATCGSLGRTTLRTTDYKAGVAFGSVSCMFALHHFFESEAMAHQLMRDVHRLLRPGGVFYGIVPNGRAILELLNNQESYTDDYVSIARLYATQPSAFGCRVAMTDTVPYQCHEYLVFGSVLRKLAESCGLQYVHIGPVNESDMLSAEEARVSRLNMVFMFRRYTC